LHATVDNSLPEIKDVIEEKQKYEKVDKKIKDQMLSDYFSKKRELSSRKSQI
jgi:hypothetical protein